jgi:hypothetical protein
MNDGIHAAAADQVFDQSLVRDVGHDQFGPGRYRSVEAGAEPVDDHDLLAGVEQPPHHVAADIAGTACYQN